MKIAISGKGGTGKTTVSGTLARTGARRGYSTLAIDCDSNPNLGVSLGLDFDTINNAKPLPRSIWADKTVTADSLIEEYGVPAPDDVTLVVAARIDQAASG